MEKPVQSWLRRVVPWGILAAAGLMAITVHAGGIVSGSGPQWVQSTLQDARQRIADENWLKERLDQAWSYLGILPEEGEIRAGRPAAALRSPRSQSMRSRLAQLESEVPLELSQAEESFLRVLLVVRRSVSAKILALRELHHPHIEAVFEEQGVPAILSHLPWAASGWNPAFSAHGRGGLFALDAPSARLYGLRVDGRVDQRRHPLLSSRAAARRLADLQQRFEDWRLALAAFGAGPAAVEKARLKAGQSASYPQLRPYLPASGRALVSAFTAGVYLAHFAQAENLKPARMRLPESMVWLDLDREVDLQALSHASDASIELLTVWNPHLLANRAFPEDGSGLWLDARLVEGARQAISQMPELEPLPLLGPSAAGTVPQALAYDDLETTSLYVVRRGDSLGRIANLYDVRISELRAWNGLRGNLIHPGQELLVRAPAPPDGVSRPAPRQTGGAGGSVYRVRRGDTLSTIARLHRVRVSDLQRWNGLDGTLIRSGQSLRVSAPPPPRPRSSQQETAPSSTAGVQRSDRSGSSPAAGFYTVRSGDTLWAIAQRTGLSVGRLERLNPKVRPRDLRPGMRLRLQEASPR